MLTDAELLLGMGRHLSTYAYSTPHAAMENLVEASQVYELAWRLRNSQLSTAKRVQAIGLDVKIGPQKLARQVLPTMETLDWVKVQRKQDGTVVGVEAHIPPDQELIGSCARLLDIYTTSAVERAALELIRVTSLQPLSVDEALEKAARFGEDAAVQALDHLQTVSLVRRVEIEVDRPVVFNPNIWSGDNSLSKAALRAQDARASTEVASLIEEVAAQPGIPEAHVKATEKKWVDFAVAQGLIQRSVVQTSSGEQQGFLFSPHLQKDPFGIDRTDPSGHVRQLVGSMIYATTFATWKLRSPGAFLYKLIRDGEAGGVPEIGTDYPMLETAGTIRVEESWRPGSFKMVLLQSDVAEEALRVLDTRAGSLSGQAGSLRSIGDQRTYAHVEKERARTAKEVDISETESARLIAALRDVASGGGFGA